MLPPTLRRVLILSPRGVDRTWEPGFALRNLIGTLDRHRAAADALAVAARKVGAATTTMFVETADTAAGAGARIATGDALTGAVSAVAAASAVREALLRPEAIGARFSVGPGAAGLRPTAGAWDDEFLKLVGPEIARFPTNASVEWVRGWARRLRAESGPAGTRTGLLSPFVVVDLPTPEARAAAKRGELPTGARLRFLASGAEYVGEEEEERLKGDFDGALDLLVEAGSRGSRLRVVRAEMEPVFRRGKDGSRLEVPPLVKVESEARLLAKLQADLAAQPWSGQERHGAHPQPDTERRGS